MTYYIFARAAVAAIMMTSPTYSQEAAEQHQAPVLSVTAVAPEVTTWPRTVQASGWLAAWQEAIVSAEISGQRIVNINVDVGSRVRKGDVLAELSRETIENTIRQQVATVESAEAALEQAKSDGDRARGLTRSGAISQQQITTYLVNQRRAQAGLVSAEAALASSQIELDRSRIIAIDDGVISSRSAALGDVVNPGAQLFRLIRQNRIEWQAEVPERRLGEVTEGTKAIIPTAFGDVPGEVRLIAPTSSGTSGRVKVFVSLQIPENVPAPRTGLLVSGAFQLGESEALTVPATAISLRDGFSYVFTLNQTSPETVSRKRIETGRRLGERVEVLTGLNATEQVVAAGGAFLAQGSVVTIVSGNEGASE